MEAKIDTDFGRKHPVTPDVIQPGSILPCHPCSSCEVVKAMQANLEDLRAEKLTLAGVITRMVLGGTD